MVFQPPQRISLLLPVDWQVRALADGRRSVIAREDELDSLTELLRQQGAQSIIVHDLES